MTLSLTLEELKALRKETHFSKYWIKMAYKNLIKEERTPVKLKNYQSLDYCFEKGFHINLG